MVVFGRIAVSSFVVLFFWCWVGFSWFRIVATLMLYCCFIGVYCCYIGAIFVFYCCFCGIYIGVTLVL